MMNKILQGMAWILLLFLPAPLFAWKWIDLWQTPDQQGAQLLQSGNAREASQVFKNKDWQAVAMYRAGRYRQAFERFRKQNTSDSQYNAGNAAAYLGDYQAAIAAYDKAIALSPNNTDAITNREIIKKLMNKKNQEKKDSHAKNACNCSKNEKQESKDKQAQQSSSAQENHSKNNSTQNQNEEKKRSENNLKKANHQGTPSQQQEQQQEQQQQQQQEQQRQQQQQQADLLMRTNNNNAKKEKNMAQGQNQQHLSEDQKQIIF